MADEESTLMIVLEASDRASIPLDELIEKIKSLSSNMSDAATKIEAAGDRIDASMAKTAAESKVSADLLKSSIDKNTDSSNNLRTSLEKVVSVMDPVSSKMKLMALGVTALTGPLSGLLALAPVALFGGMAIGAYELSKSLTTAAASGTALTATQKKLLPVAKELTTAFAPVDKAAQGAFTNLLKVVQKLAPALDSAGKALAPMVTVLGQGLGGFVTNLIVPLSKMLPTLMPVVQALAGGLITLSRGLGQLFASINVGAAAKGLTLLFNTVGMLLPILGQLLNALAPIGNIILSVLVPAIGGALSQVLKALVPVFTTMGPVITQFAGVFAELIGTFGSLLSAVVPLIPSILQLFTAFDNLDTTFEAIQPLFGAIVKAIQPLIPIIVQIASLVVNALNTGLTELATALTPLLPPLGELANSILTAFLQVLQAVLPVLPVLINSFIQLLPSLLPVIGLFTDLIKALTPVLVFAVKIGVAIVNWIIGPLGKLRPILTVVIDAFIGFLIVKQVITLIQGIGTAFRVLTLIMAENPFIAIAIVIVALAILIYTHWDQIKQYLEDAWHWVNDTARTVWGDIENFFKRVWDDITGFFKTAVKDIEDVIKGWYPVILGILSGGILLIPALIYKYWSQITGFVSRAWDDAIHWIEGVPGKIGNIFKGAGTWLLNEGEAIIQGLINGINNMVGDLEKAAKGVADTVLSYIKDPLKIFSPSKVMEDEVGENVTAGVAVGMTNNLGLIKKAGQQVANVRISSTQKALGGGSSTVGALTNSGGGGQVYIDLRQATVMNQQDVDGLVGKIGRAVATRILPQGGLRVVMK
jgi:phage-related protein